jgi:hypothetical protein
MICQHGQLQRQCELCDKDTEIERLRYAVELGAKQKLPEEVTDDDREFADYEHGYVAMVKLCRAALAGKEAVVNQSLTTGEISDGYHTFNELYEHRHALFLNLMSGIGYEPWISRLHHDGTGMDGWFIAGVDLPTGTISYHLPERLWDAAVFTGATVMERAPEWDGHTSADVVSRLYKMVAPYKDLAGEEGKLFRGLDKVERLETALRHISLASQSSQSSKEECGRIARAALAEVKDA